MRVCRDIHIVLIIVAIFFITGCSSFHALIRSVENPLGKRQNEIDAEILAEAQEAYQAKNIDLAKELYQEYIDKNRRSNDKASLAIAYSQLGRIAFDKNNFGESNRHFDKAIELDPGNLDIFGMYGESLYWQKDYVRANALFRQAIQVAPEDARFQLMLGRTLAQQKQYLLGQRYLKQSLGEQGAYEELAHIYHEHGEQEMAALAVTKARETQSKQQQLAAVSGQGGRPQSSGFRDSFGREPNSQNGYAVSQSRVGQPVDTMQVSQSPGVMPTQPYQQPQVFPPQQGQATAMQQVVIPQQNALGQQIPMQQYPVQQYPAQQSVQQFPSQQPVMFTNQDYPQPPPQNGVPLNPNALPQNPYPAAHLPQQQPQQTFEPQPQWQQDNRPPYGFAATEQPPSAYPQTAGIQTGPGTTGQNGQEIAYHPNYAAPQPGMPQPNMTSSGMPSPINPLADSSVPAWQQPAWSPNNAATPVYGR